MITGCRSEDEVTLIEDVSFLFIDQDHMPVPNFNVYIDNNIRQGTQDIGNTLGTTDHQGLISNRTVEARTYEVIGLDITFDVTEEDRDTVKTIQIDTSKIPE